MHGRGTRSDLAGRKVLIIVENLPVPFDRRVWQQALALTAAGASVTIICPRTKAFPAEREVVENILILRHPLPVEGKGPLGYLAEYCTALFFETLLAWRVFIENRFDTIQICNPPDLLFAVVAPFKLFGVRVIFDHHDIGPELFEAKFGRKGLGWWLMKALERLTFATADTVISTNQSYRQIALTRGKKAAQSVYVVRNGPDPARIGCARPDRQLRRDHAVVVGYVGVMGGQDGIDLLIETADHIVNRMGRRDIGFILAGDGPARAHAHARALELGLADHVHFAGLVFDEALFAFVASADLCIAPDRVNAMNDKSTMNKIMDYMAMGKPIVQFEVTEGRWSAGAASLYATPNDTADMAAKIVELADDPHARARMGAFGQARYHDALAWPHQVPALIAAYEHAAR